MARYCIIPSEVLPSFNFNSGHPPGSADTMIAKSVRMTLAILFDHILCPSVSFLLFNVLSFVNESQVSALLRSPSIYWTRPPPVSQYRMSLLLPPVVSESGLSGVLLLREIFETDLLSCTLAAGGESQCTHVLQRTRPNRAGCSMPKIYNQHQQCIPGLIRSSLHFLVWG